MSLLKTNFAVKSKYEAFFIGGKIQLSRDGNYMFCYCGNKVNILEISTGRIHYKLGEEEDEEVTCFCLTPDDKYIVLGTQPLLLRQWDWQERKIVRTWKAIHIAPVVSMAFDATSTLLATGSSDSTIKVWDIDQKYCTHNLKGHQGVVSCVEFHPQIERLELYSAGEDYNVRIWNLKTSTCIAEVGAHFSLVTSILFSNDGNSAFTSGRDGVVIMWDTAEHKVSKTIPVYEKLESIVLLPEGEEFTELNVDGRHPHFITAGSKGILRVWNSKTSRCVHATSEIQTKAADSSEPDLAEARDADDVQNISQMVYNSSLRQVAVVTYDHNISLFNLDDLKLQTQFAGNNDEIVDLKYFGTGDEYIIVATNSKNLKLFKIENWTCQIVYGHTDTVLGIDVIAKGNRFLTAGKDASVRVWEMRDNRVCCLAVGQGHTNPVAAVAFSKLKGNFFVSGSEDCTLKLWHLPKDFSPSAVIDIHPSLTEKAHDKEINSVTVSPNDRFIATGSMDKTAKLWNSKNLQLVGVMRGHKRGVWCVQFSPVDQILATCSSDGLVKLWSLTDFSCVRTFEGHDSSVLKISFITGGMQLLSGDSNGLVRLWTIKTNECEKVLEAHEDKIWALATNRAEDSFISGGVDSSVIVWEDITEKEETEKKEKQQHTMLQEQELSNLVQKKKYLKAIGLAIVLEQPFRVLNILKEILSEFENGEKKLHETLVKMRPDQIDALLRFASKWNTNSRHCHEAQFVLTSVLKMYPADELKQLGNIKSSVEGLIPYTERHFSRMSRLLQQSMFLEYSWQCMKGMTDRQQTNKSEEEAFDEEVVMKFPNEAEENNERLRTVGEESDDNSSCERQVDNLSCERQVDDDETMINKSELSSESDFDEEKMTTVMKVGKKNWPASRVSSDSSITHSDNSDSDADKHLNESGNRRVMKKKIQTAKKKKVKQQALKVQKKACKRKLPGRGALNNKSQKRGDQEPSSEKKPRKAHSRETKRANVKNGAKIRTTSRNR